MKVCAQCSNKIGRRDKFCNQCGCSSFVEISGKDKFCLYCGKPIDSKTKFCTNCGKSSQDGSISLSFLDEKKEETPDAELDFLKYQDAEPEAPVKSFVAQIPNANPLYGTEPIDPVPTPNSFFGGATAPTPVSPAVEPAPAPAPTPVPVAAPVQMPGEAKMSELEAAQESAKRQQEELERHKAELERLRKEQEEKAAAIERLIKEQEEKAAEIEKLRVEEEKRKAEEEKRRKEEEERLRKEEEERLRREEEERKRLEEEERKRKEEEERLRKEEEERLRKEEEERLRREEEERLRREEEERERLRKEEEERKRLEEEERKRKEEEERLRREEEERIRREEEERRKAEEARIKKLNDLSAETTKLANKAVEKYDKNPDEARGDIEIALDRIEDLIKKTADDDIDISGVEPAYARIHEILGVMYYQEGSYKLAIPHIIAANENGSKKVTLYYAEWLMKNRSKMPSEPEYLKNLLEDANDELQYEGADKAMYYSMLAKIYHDGIGLKKDYTRAFDYYNMASDLNDYKAMAKVGQCYLYGEGVHKDGKLALEWSQKAANEGNETGIRNVAVCYDFGTGTKKNGEEAIKWYKKLLEKVENDRFAMYRIAYCMADPDKEYGTRPSNEQNAEAFDYAKRAVAGGEENANYILGYMYMMGKAVSQDYNQAVIYFNKAANYGNSKAKEKLKLFVKNSSGIYKLK